MDDEATSTKPAPDCEEDDEAADEDEGDGEDEARVEAGVKEAWDGEEAFTLEDDDDGDADEDEGD